MEENLFMAEHMAKNYDKAPRPAFLLPAGKHRISPLHPPDLLRKALASPQTGSTGIMVVSGLNRHLIAISIFCNMVYRVYNGGHLLPSLKII